MLIHQLITTLVATTAVAFGAFIFLRPRDTFEIQRRFYALINWRIEPISMEKEIRNTKIMGLFLIAVVMLSCLYAF